MMARVAVRLVILFALSTLLHWHQETSATPVGSVAVGEEVGDQNGVEPTRESQTSPAPRRGFRLRGGRKRGSASSGSGPSSQDTVTVTPEIETPEIETPENEKPEKRRNLPLRRNGIGRRERNEEKKEEKKEDVGETTDNKNDVIVPDSSDENKGRILRRGGRVSEDKAGTDNGQETSSTDAQATPKPCPNLLQTREGSADETIVALLSHVDDPDYILPILEDIAMNFLDDEETGLKMNASLTK